MHSARTVCSRSYPRQSKWAQRSATEMMYNTRLSLWGFFDPQFSTQGYCVRRHSENQVHCQLLKTQSDSVSYSTRWLESKNWSKRNSPFCQIQQCLSSSMQRDPKVLKYNSKCQNKMEKCSAAIQRPCRSEQAAVQMSGSFCHLTVVLLGPVNKSQGSPPRTVAVSKKEWSESKFCGTGQWEKQSTGCVVNFKAQSL